MMLFLSFFCSFCFASDSGEYPWYFYPNKVNEIWDVFGYKGAGVVVDVLDSKINFISILEGKEYSSSNSTNDFASSNSQGALVELYNTAPPINDDFNKMCYGEGYSFFNSSCFSASSDSKYGLAKLHGTAMAGLIAGNYAKLACDLASKSSCNKDGKIVVAGIAPEAKIISRSWYPKGKLYDALSDSISGEIPNTIYGQPREKVARTAKLILLNISGGQKDSDIVDEIKRKASTKRDGDGNLYFIVVAVVGNDGIELTKKNVKQKGPLPANILRGSFTGQDMRDPIIRVGGSSMYTSGTIPGIFRYPKNSLYPNRGSNFGAECVDILAPGDKIPVLEPSLEAGISNGTSDATAIVSGAVALLSSCKPRATAEEIRQAILNNSDEYPDKLGGGVERGRVLNIYKAVSNFCAFPRKIEHKPKKG